MGTDRAQRLEAALKAVRAGVDAQIAYLQTCRYDIDHALAAEATPEPPTPEPERPAERCVWRQVRYTYGDQPGLYAESAAHKKRFLAGVVWDWKVCPYCTAPLSVEEDTHAGE